MDTSILTYLICAAIPMVAFLILFMRTTDASRSRIYAIIYIISMFMIVSYYPQFTTEYKNGYNDYPDDATYNVAKIIADDTWYVTTSDWYCKGWEQARKDKNNVLYDEITYNKIRQNISRKAVD